MAKETEEELIQCLTALRIPKSHITVGLSNLWSTQNHIRSLFIHKRLPDYGWSDHEIQWFLTTLSTLDTNGKTPVAVASSSSSPAAIASTAGDSSTSNAAPRWCGVGEREGRVYSNLVAQRHFGFSHGIGRSGDVSEPQPKAVGSSLLAKLTLHLVLDAIRRGSGLHAQTTASHGILLPLCTGMSMALVLSSLREQDEKRRAAASADLTTTDDASQTQRDVVLWSRIDQKSCFKAVTAAGLKCIVVPTMRHGDCVRTNVDAMREALETQYRHRVLAVITTTSCFAPRVPDAVDQVARLCHEFDVYHVINNAYGLQCSTTCKLINRACVVGRVDAIVASADKNFLVPVGGAIVVSNKSNIIDKIGQMYAGRASAAHVLDLFITLLSMGFMGYTQLLNQRNSLRSTFLNLFTDLAKQHGERILVCYESNTISFGMTLDGLSRPRRSSSTNDEEETETDYLKAIERDLTQLGSMLFRRCVSGTRVVPRNVISTIGGHVFVGFGSSCDDYPHAYLTAACAIGMGSSEMEEFFQRLGRTLREFEKKR